MVALIPINLVTNWILALFFLPCEPKTMAKFLGSWWSFKNICFFVYSELPPTSNHAKLSKLCKIIFWHVIPVHL